MKKRYIALGLGALVLAVGLIAAKPYISLALNLAKALRPHGHSNSTDPLPSRFTEVDRGIIEFPAPEGLTGFVSSPNPDRNAYFGDLHVHTALSYDAYV
ncbi:MAG: DUF3604 domain-containing protein, partial [Pseudomonadota bacterium]